MDIGQHGGLPSTPPRFVKRARFFRFFPEPFPYFPNISQHFQSVLIIVIFSFHSRSRPFPGIIASNSRSRILGKLFFIPFPFPNFGNAFFHSLPVPEFWEWIFLFPSHSRILGMGFFNSLPVPEPSKVIPAHPWVSTLLLMPRSNKRHKQICLVIRRQMPGGRGLNMSN